MTQLNELPPEEKIRISILRILTLSKLRLFGCVIYNFKIILQEVDQKIYDQKNKIYDKLISEGFDQKSAEQLSEIILQSLTAYVTIQDNQPTIVFYDHFVNNKTIEEITFVALHEVLHFILGHIIRGRDKDHNIYNLAADHVINRSLKNDCEKNIIQKVTIPNDAFIINELEDNLTTEEVYEYLIKNQKSSSKTIKFNLSGMKSPNSAENGQTPGQSDSECPSDIEIEATITKSKGKTNVSIKDLKKSQNNPIEDQKIIDSLKSEIQTLLNEDAISRGLVGGSLEQIIRTVIEVEVPWDKIFEKIILTKIKPDPDSRTWVNPIKRLRAHGILLPGVATKKSASTAVISIDVSGSISQQDLAKFASIVQQALIRFEQLIILKHDVNIVEELIIETGECTDESFLYKYKGRGGTSHEQVFDKLEQLVKNQTDIGIYIMLTDFDSNIEQIWKNYSWHKKVPVVVVLSKRHSVPKYIDEYPIQIKPKK